MEVIIAPVSENSCGIQNCVFPKSAASPRALGSGREARPPDEETSSPCALPKCPFWGDFFHLTMAPSVLRSSMWGPVSSLLLSSSAQPYPSFILLNFQYIPF